MTLTKDELLKILTMAKVSHSVIKEILTNQETAKAFDELHEAGFVRIKYETLKKLQEDAEKFQLWDEKIILNDHAIVEQLKERIEELENKKYEAFEQIILDELQKILESKK